MIFTAFAIRTSKFQTYLGQEVTAFLSEGLDRKLHVEKIEIIFFDRVDLEGIFVEDKFGDTLLFASDIDVRIQDWNLKETYFDVESVTLTNSDVRLLKAEGDSTFNFQHLIDYFAPEKKDTSGTNFRMDVRKVLLSDVDFTFEDQNRDSLDYGLDYGHIDLKNLKGEISAFNFAGDSIYANVNHLSFVEQSGLELKDLSVQVKYSPVLIGLDNLNLALKNSVIKATHLNLKTENGSTDFQDFLNKVRFDANLSGTQIALADLALFVPRLKGMTDEVNIKNLELNGPVNGMKLTDTDIRLLKNTVLKGDFQIPDLDEIESSIIEQKITLFRTSIADVERLNLSPFLEGEKHLSLPDNLQALNTVKLENGHFYGGINSFVVDGDITTGVGNLSSENGLKFEKENGIYYYQGVEGEPDAIIKDVILDNLDLGLLANNSNLGLVNGYVRVLPGSGGFSSKDINLLFEGNFENIELNQYTYNHILIKDGKYSNDRFDGIIDVEDDNLALNYVGYVDFKDELLFDFDLKIDSSYLAKMNLIEGDLSTLLKTKIDVNISGNSLDNIKGDVTISKLSYFDGTKHIDLSEVKLKVKRGDSIDVVSIDSDYLEGELIGQFNFAYLYASLSNQVAYLVPNVIEFQEIPNEIEENYVARLKLKDINPILNFFDEKAYVEPNTQVEFSFNSEKKYAEAHLISQKIGYENRALMGINLKHQLDSTKGELSYSIKTIDLNDSIKVDHFTLNTTAENNELFTDLAWEANEKLNPALFVFKTNIEKNNDIITQFSPSFFHLQDSKWDIEPNSEVLWNPEHIDITNLNIRNKNHLIAMNGKVSTNPDDWLNIIIKDFDLSELNGFLGGQLTLNGNLNLDGRISDLYNDLKFSSDSDIENLKINNEIVGDLKLNGKWDKVKNAVELDGDLIRDKIKTFDFGGFYYMGRSRDNIDMKLKFDHTNIAFLNAFSDPELYTNIKGNIDGELAIMGELDNPVIIGHLDVEKTRLSVPMFNVDYEINGLLNFEKGEILADYLELRDELGNLGVAMMQIYHDNYTNWNYDVTLDLADPNITQTFLAMNTNYKEGDVYYGKAFVTGAVNIFGYGGLTEINVDVTTEKGTNLTLPLYGTSETEENSFVKFYNPDTSDTENEVVKIERLGMTLDLNFEVTDEAQVNIVFDPILNDQIVANGSGNIEMSMDDYGDMEMYGKYTINEGYYDFNMKNVVTEKFEIIEGSSLVWTQSPYDANIDIQTRFQRNVDMSDIMSSEISTSKSKDLVYGYLNLSNTLLSPALTFDIQAPNARDDKKNALNHIRAIEDDLNKQFFSLLLLKKFIPVEGSKASGGGTKNLTEDLVNQQINSMLDQIGENYNLNSDIGTDHAELGFSTSFLDDKLKITSSVGYISSGDEESKGSNLVGDVNIEYELNEDGTFTVNVFNASNKDAANQDQGAFTQGFGLSYQEAFNSRKDFKLWQGFLDIFRKREKQEKNKNNTGGRKVPVETDFKPTAYKTEDQE